MTKIIKAASIPIMILLIRPMGLDINQSIVLATLTLTIILWTTGIVNKLYASIFMLVMFSVFGKTPIIKIFDFLISETFVMIVFSYIFSQGISNSKLAQKLLEPQLHKHGTNFVKFLIIILILQFVMIFVIPQPFSRIIILSIIIKEYFNSINLLEKSQSSLMFWIHASSVFINMTLIRGDLILNNALLNISNTIMSESTWIKYMAVPALIFYFIATIGFVFVFKEDLETYNDCEKIPNIEKEKFTTNDKINFTIIVLVVVIWATESIHGISGTIVVILGSSAMFFSKLLKVQDLKCVDIKLLVFLTAAFSIGRVMTYSGTSDLLFSNFTTIFPNEFNNVYILFIIVASMALHMILGSNITTLSVVLPGLLLISSGTADKNIVMFITYIAVCAHFLLPFHHVIVLIGNGNKLFSSSNIIRYAPMLTILVIFSIFFVYRTWWIIIGVL
jgi:di/tricarboxylate transporter